MPSQTSEYVTLMEMVKRVRDENTGKGRGDDPVPLSDTCYKKIFADICETKDKMQYFLRILTEAHYIFTISLIEDDDSHKMGGVYGYVIAEAAIIDNLKESSMLGLEAAYEQQFYKRNPSERIIRELLPQARMYNNTPIGRSLNMTVMLQQFSKILRVDYEEFTESWKRSKLQELLPDSFISEEKETEIVEDIELVDAGQQISESGSEPNQIQRAVDTGEIEKIQKMDKTGKWGKAVNKYGSEFLIRIHMRKYEFDKIRWLIRSGRIARETDLRYIRDSIRKMETRFLLDPKLTKYKKEMVEVKRAAQMKLNTIFQVKKNS